MSVADSSLRSRDFRRILLIKPSAFGDVVHAIPILGKLRERYPNARIDWLITPENAELIRNHPALSNVVLFPRKEIGKSLGGLAQGVKLLWQLWRNNYDLVIDLHGQARSALFTLVTFAPVRLGFARPIRSSDEMTSQTARGGWAGSREGSWLSYNHYIPIHRLDVHAIDRYLWLSPILGLSDSPPDFSVHLTPEAGSAAERLLAANGLADRKFILIVPGTIWETKHWRAEGFAEVGCEMLRRGYAVVVAGAPGDRKQCDAVLKDCPGAIDLCGQTTLSVYTAVAKRAVASITNDSGSMHLAVALGLPVVSVFGPTDPVRVGPYGRSESVVRSSIPCSPCHLRSLRACPYEHQCMQDVSAQMVIDRLDAVLASR